MASFANLTAADQRAIAKVKDGTWLSAACCYTFNGQPAVWFLRPMSRNAVPVTGVTAYGANAAGSWDITTDDAVI